MTNPIPTADGKTRNKKTPMASPKLVAQFSLCQNIGMELEELGRGISLWGTIPLLSQAIKDLEDARNFCDNALRVMRLANEPN